MILPKLLTLAAGAATAFSAAPLYSEEGNGLFSKIVSNGERAILSNARPGSKSAMKWLAFPDAKNKHAQAVSANKDLWNQKEKFIRDDDFFQQHSSALGLHDQCTMELVRKWNNPLQQERFTQRVHDIRVWGGDFHVTTGAHGVIHAHGLPLTPVSARALGRYDLASIQARPVDEKSLLVTIEKHLGERYPTYQTSQSPHPTQAVELVWHLSGMSQSKQGKVSLAYYVNGMIDHPFLSFDAFIDVQTGEVIDFIHKNGEIATSPFASPINDAELFAYDQFLKDYNDDVIYDDDTDPDPDRYSNATLVFDTTQPGVYTYPTDDWEMNLLVDNALYVKYMYYSLSNGEYLTWNKTNTDLNIEYNLTLSNAYFDGVWGIHFGSGYITDDVVSHEWSHGYTQTGNGLIYRTESGAMNEAFSDIFGEAIDILNMDTTDPDRLRTPYPTTCHETLNNEYGVPPGLDPGTRWSMGENVTTQAANGDGSLRDMYMPECWNQPGDTYSDQFCCTTYYDGGGVHKNSGILNRLFAVIVDGGSYSDPTSTTGELLAVTGLQFTKALNLFWKAHEELTPTSQFLDMATALSASCQNNIGAPLYVPNLFSSEITVSTETLTAEDCDNVELAIAGSGMDSLDDFCPNIDCEVDGYGCSWKMCPESNSQLFYEDMNYMMGQVGGRMSSPCEASAQATKFVRVFEQTDFSLNDFSVSCVQFGYYMMSVADVTLEVYIDRTGGEPDAASLELVASNTVRTYNSYDRMQVQTTDFDNVAVNFNSDTETLVVMMTIPIMTEGAIAGGGELNLAVAGTNKETYVGGDCLADFEKYSEWAVANGASAIDDVIPQWYVRVSGNSASSPSDSDDDDDMSGGQIAFVATSVAVVLGLVAIIAYLLVTRAAASSGRDEDKLNENLI
jgi:Zn-dependent metalloprotease